MTMFSNVLKSAPIVAAAALAATSVATPASAAETVYDVSDANGEVPIGDAFLDRVDADSEHRPS